MNHEKPYFSIILPTFNRAYILWKAILSVVAQKYYNWELIIIDDGSNDDTYKLVKEFRDKRMKYFKQKNKGAPKARNLGLKKAKGEYICYLDSDNEFIDDYLLYLMDHIEVNRSIVFGFCNQNVRWELYDKNWELQRFAEESSSFGEHITLEEVVERKRRFDTNGMFHKNGIGCLWSSEVKFMHDWEFLLQLANKYPKGFKHIPLSLVKYYSRYGRDGLCANSSYAEWQNDYIEIYKLHKNSNLRPSDKWFEDKIKKYEKLLQTGTGSDIEERIKNIFNF